MKAKTKTQNVALRGGSEVWSALLPHFELTQIQTTRQTLLVFEPPAPRSEESVTSYKATADQPLPPEASMQIQKCKLHPRQGLSFRGVLVNRFMSVRAVLHVASAAVPNPSFKPSPNGMPRGPGRRYAVHFRQPGPRVTPLVPA